MLGSPSSLQLIGIAFLLLHQLPEIPRSQLDDAHCEQTLRSHVLVTTDDAAKAPLAGATLSRT
jgi:hypothetical protein